MGRSGATMPEGGVLTVRIGALRLEVSVTGDGMEEETRHHCLEPYFQTLGNYLLAGDIVSYAC
jgi:signal transduction histidine kinase